MFMQCNEYMLVTDKRGYGFMCLYIFVWGLIFVFTAIALGKIIINEK